MNRKYLVGEKIESLFELKDFHLISIKEECIYCTVMYLAENDFEFRAVGPLTKDEFSSLRKGSVYLIRGVFDECDGEVGMAVECVNPGAFGFINAKTHANAEPELPLDEVVLKHYYDLCQNSEDQPWFSFVNLLLIAHEKELKETKCDVPVLEMHCENLLQMSYRLSKAINATCNKFPHVADSEVAQTVPLLYAISLLQTEFSRLAYEALFFNSREKALVDSLMEYRVMWDDFI